MSIQRDERIDYLRVTCPEPVERETDWKLAVEYFVIELIIPQGDALSKHGDFNRYFDNAARIWILTFELWGKAANDFFHHWAVPTYGTILRIDYRIGFERPSRPISSIEALARASAKKSGRTVTRLTSRPRSKKGGRDAGGEFFAVGSRDSERRSAVYKRGDEPWALEVQFGRGMPTRMRQEAVDLYMHSDGKYADWREAMMKVLYMHACDAVRSHFQMELEYIVEGGDDVDVDQQLDMFELFVDDVLQAPHLLANEQLAKLEKLVIAERNKRAIIQEEGLEEPEWLKNTFD